MSASTQRPSAFAAYGELRLRRVLALAALAVFLATPVLLTAQQHAEKGSAPVVVRYSEGTVHGFLELRTTEGTLLAYGDLLQVPGDSTIESRVRFHFIDQSVFEETVTFTQHGVFGLQAYHLVQSGPAFADDLDATLTRDGRYVVKSTSHSDGKESHYDGQLDLPSDVSNGLVALLARNIRTGESATVHVVAFTPKPLLVGLQIAFDGTDSVMIGDRAKAAARFSVKPQLGAIKRFVAKLLGKLPAESHVWILMDQVPGFIKFEGPMYSGPVWQLTLSAPTWPKDHRAPAN